jgi:DNA-binding transcriptional MerR regulator
MRLKQTYSSREVAALTGLTARQLQLWDAGGLLRSAIPSHPTARGGYTERRYTPIEVFELLALADLRTRGFSVHQLHLIVERLRAQFAASLFEATGGGGHVHLLTDGMRVFARTDAGEFYNLLDGPSQPLLDVGDEGMLKAVVGKIRKKRERKKS